MAIKLLCVLSVLNVFNVLKGSAAVDLGCAPYDGAAAVAGQSRACVCNASYCDTVEAPGRLPRGQYHVYSTSKARPGFSHATGEFRPSVAGPREQNGLIMNINASVHYQEILGFGGAITDSAGYVFNTLPKEAQERFIESYFGRNGIEYTFIRVPIGSTDMSLRKYSLNDVPYDVDMEHFNLTEECYNYQISTIKMARSASHRDVKLLASAWLVPGWMKQNWAGDNVEGWLDPSSYEALTEYHVRFIEAYRAEGLNVWAITGGNEPVLFGIFSYIEIPLSKRLNSTMMWASTQREWLKTLRPRIGPDVKFITLDEWRIFLPYWMKMMALDPVALEAADGVGLHWYSDWFSSPTLLDEFHQKYPDKLILYTESCVNIVLSDIPMVFGSWDRAKLYIFNIIENMNHWANAYMDWNIALNMEGGPTLNLPLDSSILVNETSGEFYKQPMFYAIGHFSKFTAPGARRIMLQSNQEDKDNPRKTKSNQLLLQNSGPQLPTNVMGLAVSNPDRSTAIFVFNPRNVSIKIEIEDSRVGIISKILEADSITTFVYWPS